MKNLRSILKVGLCIVFLLFIANPTSAYSSKFFTPYQVKVKGWENRLSLQNILTLTSMSSSQAEQLLLKAGYVRLKENGTIAKGDHYSYYSDANIRPIYMFSFNKGSDAKGFKNLIISHQPEMRIIQTAFLAGGYTETRVIPRKGARWTKVYRKEGFPTYSISMLLLPNMDKQQQYYSFEDYVYCLICEKR